MRFCFEGMMPPSSASVWRLDMTMCPPPMDERTGRCLDVQRLPMKTSTSRPLCFILGSGACLVPLHQLTAATWDGGAGTTKWQDATNWSTDSVPTGSETALV